MLSGNEHRGIDATGIAFSYLDGHIEVYKKDIPAWKFVSTDEYYDTIKKHLTDDVWAVLLHTRAATTGNPRNNVNNHPMFSGVSAAIHNGMIANDGYLFDTLKLERKAETDSDIVRAIVDKHGINEKCVVELNRMAGSAAIAVVSSKFPRKMILARSGSPLTTASNADHFLFSSERNTLDRALKPWTKRWNMSFQMKRADAAFAPFPDNTAWILGPEGQEGHWEFKTLNGKYVEPHRMVYERYQERQKRWDNLGTNSTKLRAFSSAGKRQKFVEGECPKCLKRWTYPMDKNAADYTCNPNSGGCGANLRKIEPVN